VKKWLEGIGRAALMGLGWAVAWIPLGLIGGTLIVGEAEPEHIGGPLYAGFLCGALFSALAGGVAGRRRLAELSLVGAAVWGTVSCLLVSVLVLVVGDVSGGPFPWWNYVGIVGAACLLSAVTAVGSVMVARSATKGTSLDAGTNVP
jgi:hypothetical protein